ncbi:MAG: nuclear transport factor 2 family protein [Blastomonas fulva]|uniref:nuclear transport factor 2 family protein n=1 Tax=Blastomonas fulva TaxID=1550728 RepID=UPI0024E1BDA5|nr:nuclear transport factor 2 family protein [Blastomonas fulva]MDK2756067.1 nuclear transport factor 2 family protein [Blastomonas fulva]
MTIDDLLAREQIRDLLARYTYAGDRGRVAELAACFADDGILEYPGNSGIGPEGILAALTSGAANPAISFIRHHITNPLIDLSGDTASARSYFAVTSNNGPDHSGTYTDRFVKTAAGWRFACRIVRIDWQSPSTLFRPMVTRP